MAILDHPLPALSVPTLVGDGIRHAFFTREGGVSGGLYRSLNAGLGSGDDRDLVSANRARIAEALGIAPDALVTMYQTHSSAVAVITSPPAGPPEVDGMVTATPGIALGVLTADCAPVLFADHTARVVGAAHAGWRGALGGVLEATVEAMTGLGAEPSRIVAAIGPTIAQGSYEVGPELVEAVAAATPEARTLFAPSERAERSLFDLPAYVAMRCKGAGIATVTDLAADTYADETRFFSYRRATHRGEADYGRLLSAIVMTGR